MFSSLTEWDQFLIKFKINSKPASKVVHEFEKSKIVAFKKIILFQILGTNFKLVS